MFLQYLLLGTLVFISPIFPPIIIPFSYTTIGALLLQHAQPFSLAIITIVSASGSSILIRVLQKDLIGRFATYRKNSSGPLARISNSITQRFTQQKQLSKLNTKLKQHLERDHGQFILFGITILAIQSAIPDLIIIRMLHKKLHFGYFLLAVILGKAIVYLPVIYIGKGILHLLHR